MNLGTEPLELGDGIEFVAQSQPFDGTAVPTDHAAWYRKN